MADYCEPVAVGTLGTPPPRHVRSEYEGAARNLVNSCHATGDGFVQVASQSPDQIPSGALQNAEHRQPVKEQFLIENTVNSRVLHFC